MSHWEAVVVMALYSILLIIVVVGSLMQSRADAKHLRALQFEQDLEDAMAARSAGATPALIDVTTFTDSERRLVEGLPDADDARQALLSICGQVSDQTKAALEKVAITIATHARCQVCGRPLLNHVSQQRGFGRVCAAKVKKQEEMTPRDT